MWLCRYVQLSTSEARVQWELGYAEAPVLRKGGVSAGGRWRRVHLLTGLVLPVWEAVQDTLADLERAADRRLKVLRLQTTGAREIVNPVPLRICPATLCTKRSNSPKPDKPRASLQCFHDMWRCGCSCGSLLRCSID